MEISIVIPVFRGEQTVRPLVEQIIQCMIVSYEIVLVYDCGPDNSWQVLCDLKNEYPEIIKIVKLSRNFGQHNALICGFEKAQGKFIVTMDEDLQHDPADISKLIATQKGKDYDVVYGKYAERSHNFFRNSTSLIFKKLINWGIPDLNNDYTAYRLIKTNLAKTTIEMRNSYTFVDGYLCWVTNHVGSCTVAHNNRLAGKSSYTFIKLIEHSINIFVTFSNFPIRLLTFSSFFIFSSTLLYAVYIFVRKIMYDDFATGYPSLIISIGLSTGFILFGLGVIGEYIYRINLKTTKRPNYNVDMEQ
jgi:glycosyltransferase involved in cell wall biosynthesis